MKEKRRISTTDKTNTRTVQQASIENITELYQHVGNRAKKMCLVVIRIFYTRRLFKLQHRGIAVGCFHSADSKS